MAKARYFKGSAHIGENIKAIKDANNLTWEEFDGIVHIGVSKLQKGDGGTVSFSDDELNEISKATKIPADAIKNMPNDDFVRTFNLYKKSHAYSDKKPLKEIFSQYVDELNETLSICCPIVIPDEPDVMKAFEEIRRLLTIDAFFNSEYMNEIIRKVLNLAEQGLDEETILLDTLSIITLHYIFYCSGYNNPYDFFMSSRKEFSNVLDAFKFMDDKNNSLTNKKRKQEFLNKYEKVISTCFDALLNSKRYRENAEFHLYLRYRLGMLSESMNPDVENYYSDAMLAFLVQTRNSVALKFLGKN